MSLYNCLLLITDTFQTLLFLIFVTIQKSLIQMVLTEAPINFWPRRKRYNKKIVKLGQNQIQEALTYISNIQKQANCKMSQNSPITL